MRIYIIGFMGSGKSQFGKNLANVMNYSFLDLDELFENRYKISVVDFFNKYNESQFRQIEKKLLISTFDEDKLVVSTGGGTACFFNNMDLMNEHGMTIYISVSLQVLYSRLSQSRKPRPLIGNLVDLSLKDEIAQLLEKREKYYQQAKIVLTANNLSAEKLAQKLLHSE